MPDHLVALPEGALARDQKFYALDLLEIIGRFAGVTSAHTYPTNQLERGLDLFFMGHDASFTNAVAWLASVGIKYQELLDQVEAASHGDPETLRLALQQGNDTQALQLLAIADASKLVELEDAGEASLIPHPLWSRAEPCFLLRLGYNTEQPYAYYCASLPGDSRRPIKLTWASIVAAGITEAVAILPPAKPVDMDAVNNALHIMEQALSTAGQAHTTVLNLLKLPAVAAASEPAKAEQAV